MRATQETEAVFIEKYSMYYPSKSEFIKAAKKSNVVPVYKEILADTLTPVSAFQKIGKGYSYLLESVEGREKIARFSFIGIKPSVILKSKGKAKCQRRENCSARRNGLNHCAGLCRQMGFSALAAKTQAPMN